MATKKRKYAPIAPPPLTAQEKVSRYMRGNKSKDTQPELLLRRLLWHHGLRGYRIHWKKLPGKPDVCYPGRKLAIFLHGCFWHRCPHCVPALPKSNVPFWTDKFTRNQARDQLNRARLRAAGWQVLVIWGCQLQQDPEGCLFAIKALHAGVPESYWLEAA
ncbi:very short patch repair endonuclease [Rufibacter sediminis]|uniref:Very short patch repair endonuclease n=1 Tax=Rufibacter sediminis TaxID=2762756 RepID=A0ABR6VTN7_9BACT|nr:very short patch repair endonuclease [Rufibacter sediminis]MBC3540509.1 very short patch repair endonuclease [Rufibacter sediminis]